MLRSLHSKLVMIMVLLILSLMMVVGAFLINSVTAFYLEDFYTQMSEVFQSPSLYADLTDTTEGEENSAEMVADVLDAYAGELGVDGRNRKLYILDQNGRCLVQPDDEAGLLNYTENLSHALTTGEVGDESNLALDYMDVAIPIQRGDEEFIIYIYDNKTTANNLTSQMFTLIVEALVFGLVISILLSFLLSKTMVIPIQRLTEGALRVAEGDFSDQIEVVTQDEIGELTDTFNDMAGQLQDTLRQVENERNKLDTLFLHMTDGVVAFSREGQVIHSNPAAGKMLRRAIVENLTVEGSVTYEFSRDMRMEYCTVTGSVNVGRGCANSIFQNITVGSFRIDSTVFCGDIVPAKEPDIKNILLRDSVMTNGSVCLLAADDCGMFNIQADHITAPEAAVVIGKAGVAVAKERYFNLTFTDLNAPNGVLAFNEVKHAYIP